MVLPDPLAGTTAHTLDTKLQEKQFAEQLNEIEQYKANLKNPVPKNKTHTILEVARNLLKLFDNISGD